MQVAGKQGLRDLNRGTILYQQGQAADDIHVVLQGWIKLFRTGETGAETIIRIAGPGDVLGEPDVFLAQGRQTSAETISHVRLLTLDGKKLAAHIKSDPALASRALVSLSAQVQTLTKHIEEMKALDALQRTAHFLLALCPQKAGGCCSLALPYEKAVIAGWLGMKPASLSRALARLRRFGVTVDRDMINIANTRQLIALVQGVVAAE